MLPGPSLKTLYITPYTSCCPVLPWRHFQSQCLQVDPENISVCPNITMCPASGWHKLLWLAVQLSAISSVALPHWAGRERVHLEIVSDIKLFAWRQFQINPNFPHRNFKASSLSQCVRSLCLSWSCFIKAFTRGRKAITSVQTLRCVLQQAVKSNKRCSITPTNPRRSLSAASHQTHSVSQLLEFFEYLLHYMP